jgi:hypothetical protein
MMRTGANKQRGMGLAGIILSIAAALFVVILGMKMVPAYIHNMQIQRIFQTIIADPGMQNASVKDIRDSYSKRATMDYISDITADDIEIGKEGTSLSLSANYTVKIPVIANVSLILEFSPSAAR